tara:strand:+ start:1316 stop:1465 length:150 start_codon:yes stop_codon:yes gene_type:complete
MDPRLKKDIDNFNNKNGKGSKYRFSTTDKQYQENYKKIFRKKKKNEPKR